jgi:hypothetical protein
VVFPEIETADDGVAPAICDLSSGDVYLAGDEVVWRGTAQEATADTLTPIEYKYAENTFELFFAADIDTLYVGQILVVTRALSWGTQSGSEEIRAYIVRVERGTDRVRVRAVDALGYLGVARCRRPSILNDTATTDLWRLLSRLVARVGLEVADDGDNLSAATILPFTVQPMESLLGAAYRAAAQSAAWLVPHNTGQFAVTAITPGVSQSGSYDDEPHQYGESPSQQPLIRAAEVSDYRRLGFAYVLGTFSTDPEDGGYVAMAAGPALDNTRPLSYSLTNNRYNSESRVHNAATAEAARQEKLPITAVIEANANLALELYDVIEVDEARLGWSDRQFRVRAIVERWERGWLTQEIFCGEV